MSYFPFQWLSTFQTYHLCIYLLQYLENNVLLLSNRLHVIINNYYHRAIPISGRSHCTLLNKKILYSKLIFPSYNSTKLVLLLLLFFRKIKVEEEKSQICTSKKKVVAVCTCWGYFPNCIIKTTEATSKEEM